MNSWTSWKEVVGTSLQDGWAFSPSKSKGAKCPTDITLKVSREKYPMIIIIIHPYLHDEVKRMS